MNFFVWIFSSHNYSVFLPFFFSFDMLEILSGDTKKDVIVVGIGSNIAIGGLK